MTGTGETDVIPLVGVIMGSDSDLPVMAAVGAALAELGIPYEERIVSAHRTPDAMRAYADQAESQAYLARTWYADLEKLRVSAAAMIGAHRDEVAVADDQVLDLHRSHGRRG